MPDIEELLYPTRTERVEDRRKERQQRKLVDEFFDHATLLAIGRLVNQGQFQSVDYPISTGKEGGVFRASGPNGFRAVKIYRIGNTIFRHVPPYVIEWLRREVGAMGNTSRMIFAWTRREHTVLSQLRAAEVRVPQPFACFRNVLVMEFVGVGGLPAPPMQEIVLRDPDLVYADLTTQLRRMVVAAHLVHGDLSPYNVLVLEDRPYIIDVAQAIPTAHPQARELLLRDATNFARYFRRLGVDTSPEEFFEAAGGTQMPVEATA
ncbi:MAG TPA: serine protein kinase RIO [Thermoplasmata archaeon]|nr:serine protein kinase RIO [Thermoplasmata archaeon]